MNVIEVLYPNVVVGMLFGAMLGAFITYLLMQGSMARHEYNNELLRDTLELVKSYLRLAIDNFEYANQEHKLLLVSASNTIHYALKKTEEPY